MTVTVGLAAEVSETEQIQAAMIYMHLGRGRRLSQSCLRVVDALPGPRV